MPKVIDSSEVPKRHGGRKSRYPITEWLDQCRKLKNGDRLCLNQGEDFDSTVPSFRNYLHLKARQLGVKLSTITSEDALYISVKESVDGDAKATKPAKSEKTSGKSATKSGTKGKRKAG